MPRAHQPLVSPSAAAAGAVGWQEWETPKGGGRSSAWAAFEAKQTKKAIKKTRGDKDPGIRDSIRKQTQPKLDC